MAQKRRSYYADGSGIPTCVECGAECKRGRRTCESCGARYTLGANTRGEREEDPEQPATGRRRKTESSRIADGFEMLSDDDVVYEYETE